jgi:pimeloyl-ACP methyl ester carboxylesterase
MLLAAAETPRVQAVLINDVGPELDEAGVARIRTYVGRSSTWPTWVHAARDLSDVHRISYPGWELEDWLVFAKRVGKLGNSGRVTLDYDMRIAEPFKLGGAVAGMDMWSAWRAMADVPALAMRGELSDILAPATLERMAAEHPRIETVTIAGVGHSPTLDEPEAQGAIDRLLTKAEERRLG